MPSTNEDKNILSQAREFIHETVQTDARKEAEKTPVEKFKDAMPESAEEAGQKVGSTLDKVTTEAKENFKKNVENGGAGVDEDRDETDKDKGGNLLDSAKGAIDNVRERIYDATKSKEELDKERK